MFKKFFKPKPQPSKRVRIVPDVAATSPSYNIELWDPAVEVWVYKGYAWDLTQAVELAAHLAQPDIILPE